MRRATLLLALSVLATAATARGADPAVARPRFLIGGESQTRGLVFFVAADVPAGAAAVGTAHTFDLVGLTQVRSGQLVLGSSGRVVAGTSGFLTQPGRPFNTPGATLADDYVVYALDAAPEGVRLLPLGDSSQVKVGGRVQLLGVPASGRHDEDDLFGRVAEVAPERIEVDLDVPYDLRGWGGAPVLDEGSGRVVGVLQAYYPRGSTSRVILSPISGVARALARPLDAGRGRPFARFEGQVVGGAGVEADATREAPSPRRPQRARSAVARAPGPIIEQTTGDGTRVHLTVEYPPPGAVVGRSACGAFVSGRAIAMHGELRRFDVVLVLDTSRSTNDVTGADINGNGVVGKPTLGYLGSIFDAGSTDPGDTILAAEVAAARQLLHGLDPRSTRVSVVTFAGDPPDAQSGLFGRSRPPAMTIEPLTHDYALIERALDRILATSPEGSTHMAAGVDQATIELMGLRGALSQPNPESEKIVLFFTDGQPTMPYGPGFEADNVRAVLRAANRADRANIRIHSFAIGPDALAGPVATVEMAERTEGYFTPVRHPGDLVDAVEEVSFANLEKILLKSLTTGEEAVNFRTTADGFWAGFVGLEDGANELEVRARAADGAEAVSRIQVAMREDGADPPVPEGMLVARNRLLEECLRAIKEVRMTAERERAEAVRKDLLVEIERERAAARERAAEQRKQLQLGVDEDAADAP